MSNGFEQIFAAQQNHSAIGPLQHMRVQLIRELVAQHFGPVVVGKNLSKLLIQRGHIVNEAEVVFVARLPLSKAFVKRFQQQVELRMCLQHLEQAGAAAARVSHQNKMFVRVHFSSGC
jgi:hypothetical protein